VNPPPKLPEKINPHDWRKFERAQRNMLRFFRARKIHPARKWGREMKRLMERIVR
jgi:hypothetical protein